MSTHGPWYCVGPLIGLLVVALYGVANRPLGALGGTIELLEWTRQPRRAPGWRVFVLVGIVLGGVLHALLSGAAAPLAATGFALLGPSGAGQAATLAGAGLLIGYGARTAGGCTSGHGISGCALGQPASLLSTAVFMGTAIASAHLLGWLVGGGG